MERLIEFLREMSPRKLMLLGGISLFVIISIIASILLLSAPRYALLYGNLDGEDSGSIIQALEGLGEKYKIGKTQGSILVSKDRVFPVRGILAEQGLPSSEASIGYELFDQDQGFGTSNFVQELNHLRALEGELARTIQAISGINKARVHLVLPKRELFSRDRREPRASIILSLSGKRELSPSQVRAIRSLVSSAVPDLSSNNISIVDGQGTLLARGGNDGEGSTTFSGSTPDEIRQSYEDRLSNHLIELVESVVGYGNVRVQIQAEMDFSQVTVNEEIFDPDGQVLRSSEEINENSESTDSDAGAVTVENNLPGEEGVQSNVPRRRTVTSSSQTVNNYEISKQVINRVEQPGTIERLSVAVLVDGNYAEGEEGTQIYTERTAQELQQIERLVKTAIGFDSTVRQDVVEIVNLRFAQDTTDLFADETSFLGFRVTDLQSLIELVILSIVALVIFLLVLRPLIMRALLGRDTIPDDVRVRLDGTLVDAKTGEPLDAESNIQAGGGSSTATLANSLFDDVARGDSDFDFINIADGNLQVRQGMTKQINEVVQRYPNETNSVIKGWLLDA